MVASVPTATRCPSPGYFVEPGDSRDTLKFSAILVLCLYPAFLVISDINIKLVILGLLGFLNAGWYSILQGRLYTAMPGQSGTVMTLNNLAGLVGGLIPLALGWVAQKYGLPQTMWLLLAAPIALLIGLFQDM